MSEASVTLSNGVAMPLVGLGVWTPDWDDATEAVKYAIENGYRLIDTAAGYANERQVGRAARESGVPREQLFITTKVANGDQGYDDALRAFETSLSKLDMDYVDLYLIHWPVEGKSRDTWRALERIYDEKGARAIGVSNFMIEDLEALLPQARIKPMVNQIEFHPYLTRPELRAYCVDKGIQLEAWSPLMKGALNDPVLGRLAAKYGKTAAQIVLRWDLQNGFVTIPKSFNKQRLLENRDVFGFELSEEDMALISSLNRNEKLPPPTITKPRPE